ncbi:MAG TPA: YkvA family protein, partial [Membranihabitans sp.]|nr:YkvA family protein [Membranihabitans sp.]
MRTDKILNYVQSKIKALGFKLAYIVLLQFYAYNNPQTPRWAKNIILGALGYLLTPIDSIVDVTPFIGYTDDIGVLSFALVTISAYITDDVKIKARQKLQKWTGSLDMDSIQQ